MYSHARSWNTNIAAFIYLRVLLFVLRERFRLSGEWRWVGGLQTVIFFRVYSIVIDTIIIYTSAHECPIGSSH